MTEQTAETAREAEQKEAVNTTDVEAGQAAQDAAAEPTVAVPERGRRKVREGLVLSDKMDKTVVVEVQDRVKHSLYGKVIRRTSKLKAHDESNTCGTGDRVLVMETRPLSATKCWRVVRVIEKAK